MKIRPAAGCCVLCAAHRSAQDGKSATTLGGVELTGLTPAQKATVVKMLREQGCSCGCNMKIAQCRVEDPGCSFSRGLAGVIVGAIKEGKKEKDALAAAAASRFTPKLLDPPVAIPTAGSPVTGAAAVRCT